ncbi:MAG: hypothetical protein H6673_07915 [Anaerolineales bacterium]|nr:hypothetical protein [Anaerolineales bacterium]
MEAQRIKVPPVMLIEVEDSMDLMLARNTARRAASLLGFNTASRAQIAGAVASLVSIILNAGEQQVIHLHGLRQGVTTGLQIRCEAPWLASASPENAALALKTKLGSMVDEAVLVAGDPPSIEMVLWRSEARSMPRKTAP